VQQARAARLTAWAAQMQRRQRVRFLAGTPLRMIGRLRKPRIDTVGTYAVHSISRHTDRTHASVLTLIDELLGVGRRDERVSARVIAARARTLDASV
jgi:hypothetical protein